MADETSRLPLSALSTEPTSKEDALSARLRTLRNASASPRAAHQGSGPASRGSQAQPQLVGESTTSPRGESRTPPRAPEGPEDDADAEGADNSLIPADDSTLDELLESLDLDDDVSLDQPPPLTLDPGDEAKKVAALLAELRKPARDPSHHDGADVKDDDDSEGEEMSAEVKQLLFRALDEAELDRSLPSPGPPDQGEETRRTTTASPGPGAAAPETPQDQTSGTDKDTASAALSLPAVPSQLVDPEPHPPTDFESAIAARMARLKGVSYGTSSASDTFGLPQAPSFDPDARTTASAPKAASSFAGPLSGGYTDEDQKTWCVVCLEDATIRCVGCDGDVYCGRCWRDMHVGPRAGWDERGHRWVRFERATGS